MNEMKTNGSGLIFERDFYKEKYETLFEKVVNR